MLSHSHGWTSPAFPEHPIIALICTLRWKGNGSMWPEAAGWCPLLRSGPLGIPVKLPRAQSAANLHEVLIAGEVQGAVPGGNPLITCRRWLSDKQIQWLSKQAELLIITMLWCAYKQALERSKMCRGGGEAAQREGSARSEGCHGRMPSLLPPPAPDSAAQPSSRR